MHDKGHRTFIENAEFVVSSIRELGLYPNPESRIMRMYRIVVNAKDGFIESCHPDFEIALEAIRDMQVLAFVFDQAAKYSQDAEFIKLVRVALKDSVLPQDDKTQSKGRDAQFELYIAAVCQNAGMLPVAREEPDVTCNIGDTKFGIAIKRLKSASNLEQHIRKAAKQISECRRIAGIIVLDMTFALNRNNEPIKKPIPYEELCRLHRNALHDFIKPHHERLQEWVRKKEVRGVVFHDQHVRFTTDADWELVAGSMVVNTARDNDRRNKEYNLFYKGFDKGLPHHG